MSDILIKGMEMPQKCGQCKLFHAEHPMYCLAVEGHRTVGAPYGMPRPDWCPLVEVKEPHGKLIDADEIVMPCLETTADQKWMEIAIKSTPTVIEAEGSET